MQIEPFDLAHEPDILVIKGGQLRFCNPAIEFRDLSCETASYADS